MPTLLTAPAGRRLRQAAAAASIILLCLLWNNAPTAAQTDGEPLLFQLPKAPKTSTPPDPAMPSGPLIERRFERPDSLQPLDSLCSRRRPVCVHAARGTLIGTALAEQLAALEWAYERIVLVLGAPAPLPDAGAGGSDSLDLYLSPGSSFASSLDALQPFGFDRGSAFCQGAAKGGNFALRQATLCVAEATAWRLDAGMTPHHRRAYATALWWRVGPSTTADVQAIDRVSRRPEAPIFARSLSPLSEGSAIFLDYLEEHYGQTSLGELSIALSSQAAQMTPTGRTRYVNEPDTVDVLRETFFKRSAFANLVGKFALYRALAGERDDARNLPGIMWAGPFANAAYAWSLESSSLPRRVLLPAIAPNGATFVWLALNRWREEQALALRAEWEAPVSFKWLVAELDTTGALRRIVDIPFKERGRSVQHHISDLRPGHQLIIATTQLGGTDLAHPFDPDVAPYEPHASTLYLTAVGDAE